MFGLASLFNLFTSRHKRDGSNCDVTMSHWGYSPELDQGTVL